MGERGEEVCDLGEVLLECADVEGDVHELEEVEEGLDVGVRGPGEVLGGGEDAGGCGLVYGGWLFG